jgi:effector-binding domain-containing protein
VAILDYEFKVIDSAAQPTLAVRTRAAAKDLPAIVGKFFGTVYQYLLEIGEQPVDAAYTAYFNMDPNDLDMDIGFLVAKPLPGRGDVHAGEIPGGKQVSYMYKGPYSQMEPVYAAMMEWMTANNYVPTGTAYELYYNDPSQVPESELLTKIILPVQD